MFTNPIRVIIGITFLLAFVLLVSVKLYEFAAVALAMVALLTWDYFKQGTLVIAAKHFHHKDFEKTQQVLLQIKKPEWLSKKRRGYYEFLMGGVCLQKQDFGRAGKHYEMAAQYPLRSVNDHIAALAHVANISIRHGDYEKAASFLQLTDKHREEMNAKMKDVIDRLKQELKKHKI